MPTLRRVIDPNAIYAGMIAALISLLVETPVLWFVYGDTQWAAARMTAAMVLGARVLSPPTFDLTIVAVASIIHVGLSVGYGLALAPLLRRRRLGTAVGVGVVYGLLLYAVNLHGIAPILFPWFSALQTGLTVFSHAVFGATLGASYVLLRRR
jgi:hypothetical protein